MSSVPLTSVGVVVFVTFLLVDFERDGDDDLFEVVVAIGAGDDDGDDDLLAGDDDRFFTAGDDDRLAVTSMAAVEAVVSLTPLVLIILSIQSVDICVEL